MFRTSPVSSGLLGLLLSCAVHADFEAKEVNSVSLLGTTATIPLETRVGQLLDPLKLEKDVKTLWRSGQFADVRAEALVDGEGVRIVFRCQAKRLMLLRRVQVSPPTPAIDLTLAPESTIDPFGASQIAQSARKKLEESGFPFAKVEANLRPVGSNHVDLIIHVEQGQKLNINQTTVVGDLGTRGADARKVLQSTRPKLIVPRIPGIWNGWRILPGYSYAAVRSDLGNLQSFYNLRGYFDADISADQADMSSSRTAVRFHVRAGPRYAIREIRFPAGFVAAPIHAEVDGGFPAHAFCKALFHEEAQAEQTGVVDFAASIIIHDLPGPPSSRGGELRKSADIETVIQKGPAYRVGRINFIGNHSISDITMRRSLLISEAEPLNEMLLRKSLARLNATGLFERLSESNVVINTPPGSDRADIAIRVREQKPRHWYLSGPVGPMSIGGSLQFAIGSRLPPWGQGLLELATYTVSAHLMLLPKPLGSILPGLPNRRFFPLLTIQRPLLPGQRFLSGFTVAPQTGWLGMLTGYGVSETRGFTSGLFENKRSYQSTITVSVTHVAPDGTHEGREGSFYCKPTVTAKDRAWQVMGTATRLVFSLSPY